MALEQVLEENTKALLSVAELLKITAVNQERLIAGQGAAIDKIEPEKRTRAKKDQTAGDGGSAATETKPKDEPAAAAATTTGPSAAREVSADQLKAIGLKLLEDAVKKDGDAGGLKIKAFIEECATELGTPKLNGPTSNLDAIGRLKAAFYLERKGAGLDVDFAADYDFDGDPTQGGGEPATEDDEF